MNRGQFPANAGTAPRFRASREVPAGAPIHQSLVNPVLIMGMERKPAISLLTTVAALFLGPGLHVYTFAWATLLLLVGTYALVKLAQFDPQMDDVLVRYAAYDRVYDPEAPATCISHGGAYGTRRSRCWPALRGQRCQPQGKYDLQRTPTTQIQAHREAWDAGTHALFAPGGAGHHCAQRR